MAKNAVDKNVKVIRAAKTIIDTLREEGAVSEDEQLDEGRGHVWQKPYEFEAPPDGKLRFRDLAIGEQFHFMGSWPGVDHAIPGRRTYTKVSNRRFSYRDGDTVTVSTVRGDLVEVARSEPAATV